MGDLRRRHRCLPQLRRGHGASRDRFCSHRSRRDLALPHHGEASAAGDIVVVSVPVKAFPDLSAAPLAGKTVIDTCNYGPERDGHIPELDGKSLTSSELLLSYIRDAMLVKAFNNIFFKYLLSLARPAGAADRSYLPIAGDSAPAKAAVTEFIDSIGYSVLDAGSVADSWRQATGTPVLGDPIRAVLERERPTGRRGRHPRGTGHRNAVRENRRGPLSGSRRSALRFGRSAASARSARSPRCPLRRAVR